MTDRIVTAKRPNRVWHVDLMAVPFGGGFWVPYAGTFANRGIALAAQNRWPEATAAFRQAVQLQPRFSDAHSRLGQALAAQEALQEAAVAFRQAIQLAGNSFDAHRNLGNTLFDLEDLPGAIDAYQQALRLRAYCADTHCQLAIALTRRARFVGGCNR